MLRAIKTIFAIGPLIFAFGFLAPLIAQTLSMSGVTPPFGLSPLETGFILAGTLGLAAQIRGRWL